MQGTEATFPPRKNLVGPVTELALDVSLMHTAGDFLNLQKHSFGPSSHHAPPQSGLLLGGDNRHWADTC